MRSNAKKIILTSAITLFLSAGLTSAAEALQTRVDGAHTTIRDGADFGGPTPCAIERGSIRDVANFGGPTPCAIERGSIRDVADLGGPTPCAIER